ncbi:ECF-type sigma factor [Dokdonella koreensis]|uniref:RNA polymerase, sigma subunit, ECF family n=1 Tax=Dokdonella koreensis DS-123 TaxID=1300342 RepID=A0A167G848_9GAMM|nr:ECF-type sigma factor [Dokdonella koreensis]ANB16248.1 RNA polymerase, sigma subunit, ECF family [Dokdonella koreensis DS-123]
MADLSPAITSALAEAHDAAGRDRLLGLVYEDMLRIARAQLRRQRSGNTLDTRALVNEAYLKLFDGTGLDYANRTHFFATAARAMRQVAIDYARARLAERRGGGAEHVDLDALEEQPLPVDAQAEQLLAIDAALHKLAGLDERLVKVVELRFFAGLDVKDIAVLLEVSEPTIKRDTRAAKAFLQRELAGAAP